MGAYLHPEKRPLFRVAVVAAITLLSLHFFLYRRTASSHSWPTIPLQTHLHATEQSLPSPSILADSNSIPSKPEATDAPSNEPKPTYAHIEPGPNNVDTEPKPIATNVFTKPKPATATTNNTPFPKKLWQTSKHGIVSMEADARDAVASWLKLNSDWRYEVLSDSSAETYVRTTFASRPDLTSTYFSIGDPILRADMLRYLVLLGDGGVYSDTDTRCLRPISSWVPSLHEAGANVVVGVEYDRMDGGRWLDWTLDLQFANWAIMAKPGHPALDLTLRRLSEAVHAEAARKHVPVQRLQLSQHEILNATGPARLTMGIFEYLRGRLGAVGEEEFGWRNVSRLKRPVLVEDVLILPINGFGSGQPHSGSGKATDEDSLVEHLFKGSWKHDRPMLGQQEQDEEKEKKEKEEREKKEREEREKKEREEKERVEREAKEAEEKKQREETQRREAEEARLVADQAKATKDKMDAEWNEMMERLAKDDPQTPPNVGQIPGQNSGSAGNEVRTDNANVVAG